jgi:hypothetical protein
MGDKKRWTDPANDGQVDYIKVGIRMFAFIMLLALAAVIKIAIANHWLDSFSENARILGF